MASPSFRENLARVLQEAHEQDSAHDVGLLLDILDLFDQDRHGEMQDRIARLRPIFRTRIGTPPDEPARGP